MTDEFRHRTRLEVRFRDVDAFGHVNNAVFLSYIEQGRIRYLARALQLPITLTDVEELPLILARNRGRLPGADLLRRAAWRSGPASTGSVAAASACRTAADGR